MPQHRRTMDAKNVYERALERAAARVGGMDELARRLGVPADRLAEWPQQPHPDMAVLVRLMEIVLDE